MSRPQFTLKTLLCWTTLLPAAVGIFFMGRDGGPAQILYFETSGMVVGFCIGIAIKKPIVGAVLGFCFVYPLLFAIAVTLLILGVYEMD